MSVSLSRRATTLLVAVFGALVAMVGLGLATASAAPYGTDSPSVGLSSTAPCAGGTMSAGGSGFGPGEAVTVVLNSEGIDLGTVTAGADGSFTVAATVPADMRGAHTLSATSASGTASASFTVTESCMSVVESVATSPTAQGSTGPVVLAYTGVPAYALAGTAVLLLGGGAALVVVGRRRSEA